jgi:hypothetical protein
MNPRADARTRTADPFITSEVLYQLSYVGVRRIVAPLPVSGARLAGTPTGDAPRGSRELTRQTSMLWAVAIGLAVGIVAVALARETHVAVGIAFLAVFFVATFFVRRRQRRP